MFAVHPARSNTFIFFFQKKRGSAGCDSWRLPLPRSQTIPAHATTGVPASTTTCRASPSEPGSPTRRATVHCTITFVYLLVITFVYLLVCLVPCVHTSWPSLCSQSLKLSPLMQAWQGFCQHARRPPECHRGA